MVCDECRKRPATVHLTKIVNDHKTEAHLCETCAREKGEGFMVEPTFSFSNLLAGLLDADSVSGGGSPLVTRTRVRCQTCGLSFGDFRRLGRLGCSECYQHFDRQLEHLLRRIHGATEHAGKAPARIGGRQRVEHDLERLRQELQEAIAREEYERAAELRDRIRRLGKDPGKERG